MSDITIETKNDYMLGRLNESNILAELIKAKQEIKELENIIDNARNYIENNQCGGTDKDGQFHLNFTGNIWKLYEMLRRF